MAGRRSPTTQSSSSAPGSGPPSSAAAAAPISELDRLLGAAPLAGGLIRCPVPGDHCLERIGGELVRRPVLAAEPCPSLEGLEVRRVTAVGAGAPVDDDAWSTAWPAWLAASTGYLAGLGEAALDLTVDYVRNRAAFGATLGALAPVQQLLAGAATAVRGVALLCADGPGEDALRHAGPAVRGACDACHQVSGAIGYTLEYPLAPVLAARPGAGDLERRAAGRLRALSAAWPLSPAARRPLPAR